MAAAAVASACHDAVRWSRTRAPRCTAAIRDARWTEDPGVTTQAKTPTATSASAAAARGPHPVRSATAMTSSTTTAMLPPEIART